MRQKQNVRFECRLRVCVQSPWWQSHWYWRGYAEGVGFLPWSEDWWWLRNKSWSVSRCHQETEWDLLHVSDVTGKSEDRKCDSMIFYLQVEANIALAKDEILLSYWGDIGSPLPLHPPVWCRGAWLQTMAPLVIYAHRDRDQWEKVYDLFYVYLLTRGKADTMS